MVAEGEGALGPTAGPQAPDLLRLHEAIASLFATQGDWRRAYQHLRSALDIARDGSLRDALTSSFNRRYLDERLYGPFTDRPPLALALIDLDRFKSINDTYGHLVGDRVLRRVAELLQEDLPPNGFCARYGGEEFVLVLSETDEEAARVVCEKVRGAVADHPWTEIAPDLALTVSIGYCADTSLDSAERMLAVADAELYAAKAAGRNRVCGSGGSVAPASRPRLVQ